MALTYTVHIKDVDIDKNLRAFQFASELLARGNNVQLVLTDKGVMWAKEGCGYLDSPSTEGDTPYTYFSKLESDDVEILVLDSSAYHYDIGHNDVIANAEVVDISTIVSFMEETQVIPV